MAWKSPKTDEVQTDPFNAPDPVMPSEEPATGSFVADGKREERGGRARRRRIGRARRGDSGSDASASSHTTRAQQDDASSDASASSHTTQRTHKARRDRHTWHMPRKTRRPSAAGSAPAPETRKRMRAVIIVFVLVCVIGGIVGPALFACSVVFDALFDDSDSYSVSYSLSDDILSDYDSSDDDWIDYDTNVYNQVSTDLDVMARDETIRMLDSMIAGDEYYLDLAEQAIDDRFELYYGITAEELGIDARALAAELMGRMTYELDSSYCYGYTTESGYDMDCSVYFDLSMPSADSVVLAVNDHLPDGLSLYAIDAPLSASEQEAVRTALDTALQDSSLDTRNLFMVMEYKGAADLDGENCALEFDQDSWDTSFEMIV